MHTLTRQDLENFTKAQNSPVVSIYMPTHRISGPEVQQDKIKLKNYLQEARKQLEALGVKSQDIDKQLKPADQLIDDEYFWSHQDHGIALMLGRDQHRIYKTPYSFAPIMTVGKRYHIKQLLPILDDTFYYYILQLSPNSVRLLRAKHDTIDEIDDDLLPQNLTDALGTENDKPHLSFHTGTAGKGAVFHGHNDINSYKKSELQKFTRMVADKVDSILKGKGAPLVLACVEPMEAMFRKVYSGKQLHSSYLSGSFDEASAQDLHSQSLPLVEDVLNSRSNQALAELKKYIEQNSDKALLDIHDVFEGLGSGKVSKLLVAQDESVWGEAEDSSVSRVEDEHITGLHDLTDVAAASAFDLGREVFVVAQDEMPDGCQLAAILH